MRIVTFVHANVTYTIDMMFWIGITWRNMESKNIPSLAFFQQHALELCNVSHQRIYRVSEVLDTCICWNITDALWYYLADMSESIDVFDGIGYEQDAEDFFRKYLMKSKLLICVYEPDGMYTHWFAVLTVENIHVIVETTTDHEVQISQYNQIELCQYLENILNGRKPDSFYNEILVAPQFRMEVYDIHSSQHPIQLN